MFLCTYASPLRRACAGVAQGYVARGFLWNLALLRSIVSDGFRAACDVLSRSRARCPNCRLWLDAGTEYQPSVLHRLTSVISPTAAPAHATAPRTPHAPAPSTHKNTHTHSFKLATTHTQNTLTCCAVCPSSHAAADVRLLPETFVVLIHGLLNQEPPDVEAARDVSFIANTLCCRCVVGCCAADVVSLVLASLRMAPDVAAALDWMYMRL